MSSKEYIAYSGEKYIIEWYFDEKGNSQALEYFYNLSAKQQDKLFYLFKRIGDFGRIDDKTKFRFEGDNIFAFKPQPDRFLSFFVKGNKIIVANAFRKKTQKLPKNEKDRAVKILKDYNKRLKDNKYYE